MKSEGKSRLSSVTIGTGTQFDTEIVTQGGNAASNGTQVAAPGNIHTLGAQGVGVTFNTGAPS